LKKIFLSIFIVFLFSSSPLISAGGIKETNLVNDADIPASHLIENVQYVSQLPGHCFFACLEMIYKYYGIENISQSELSALQGQAYSLLYQPSLKAKTHRPFIKPSYKYYYQPSIFSNQGNEDIRFVADLLGFEVENHHPDKYNSHIENWNNYWSKLKETISNNTPLITCIDLFVWPLYLEPNKIPKIKGLIQRDSHSILVVGYNESNQTVCVHDPYSGQLNESEKGTYYWTSLSLFKRGVRRAHWDIVFSSYDMYIFKKVNSTLSKEEIFEECHDRNIEKMKGNKTAYDKEFYRDNFEKFGIEVWQQMKKDFDSYFIQFLPIYRILNRFTWMPFDMINVNSYEAGLKSEVAELLNKTAYVLENQSLKDIYIYESKLFFNESKKLDELASLTKDLKNAVEQIRFFKSYFESRIIVDNICDKIDEIISIEEAIIAGPSE